MLAASPSAGSVSDGARIRPAGASEPVMQLRFSRMAPEPRGQVPGGPGDGARVRGWGLSRLREPQDGGAGPSFDSGFVPSTEQRRKEPAVREGRREPLIYITVASVVAVLLAMGGLLFYKCRSRVSSPLPLPRRQHPLLPQFPHLCPGAWGLSPTFPIILRWGGSWGQVVVLRGVGGCYLGDSPRHCMGNCPAVLQPPPHPQGSPPPFPFPLHRSWNGHWKMETATPRSRRGGGCSTILPGGAVGTPALAYPALNPPDFPPQGAAGSEGMSRAGDSGPLR